MLRLFALLAIMSLTYLIGYTSGSNNNEQIMLQFDQRCKK